MKNKLFRIFGVSLVLILLIALVPAAAVFGTITYATTISPATGTAGSTVVTVTGTYYHYSVAESSGYIIQVYFSSQDVGTILTAKYIDTNVTTYKIVAAAETEPTSVSGEGNFAVTFVVPTTMVDGTVDVNTVASGTYYVYTTETSPTATAQSFAIKSRSVITVASPALDPISPTSGPAGTDVVISGYSFPASTTIVYKVDSVQVIAKSGHTVTTGGGSFLATITIPSTATAGSHTISVTAGAATASTTFTVTAAASLSPIVPVSGAAGTDVTITGANFPPNGSLIFKFDTTVLTPKAGSLQTGSNGSFMSIVTVPSTATAGAYLFTIQSGTTSLTASFTVTGSSPPATTTPAATTTPPATTTPATPSDTAIIEFADATNPIDTVSNSVALNGADFSPGTPMVYKLDDVQIGTGTASARGFISVKLVLPAIVHGDHTITATDIDGHRGTLVFSIESIPPNVPSPLAPGMNAKLKAPVTFDWGDVTDASEPVTYELQIGTDPTFTESTIIINKTKLATSGYTLTEMESALLANPAATYYWRERAMDAVQNPSAWTGAGAFSVSQPLKFTDWPMYVTMAGIGVVAFLLGLFLGRRTAFSY